MKLVINGRAEELTVPENGTVSDALTALAVPPQIALVEHNGVALTRDHFSQQTLAEGDRLEILRIAAGG